MFFFINLKQAKLPDKEAVLLSKQFYSFGIFFYLYTKKI